MTQLKQARQGIITPEMIEVAEAEGVGANAAANNRRRGGGDPL